MQRASPMTILDLPDCMLENILEYMSYDEVARKRIVCRPFDKAGQRILNRGFNKMIRTHAAHLKRLKALLPRRESERRNHPLARHTDILTCIETRISMLSMTYSKYIDLNLCCFIPGKVIDEVYNIFKLIKYDTKPLRAHEVLQELRDISSMAIEHFDEKIANGLKKSYMSASPGRLSVAGSIGSGSDLLHLTPPSLSVDDMGEVMPRRCDGENNCRQARMNKMALVRMETKYKNAIKKFTQMIQIQNKQMRHLRCNSLRISQLTSTVADLKRQIEESEAKNREIKANISQIAQEAGSSISSAPVPMRNIKPRAATIILKRRITQSISDTTDFPEMKQIKLDEYKDEQQDDSMLIC